jgi:ferritin-like metal-binding protein YciE
MGSPLYMATDYERLNRYLNEALATERALVTTLVAHIAMTPRGDHRTLLERHLRETREHARALSRHASEPSTNIVNQALGLAETVVGQALTLAKGPLDLVRGGTNIDEKQLKNAKDECATEALEIATYDAIEALADQLGEDEIADLARSHRAEEERMLADLRALIPTLAADAQIKAAFPIDDYDSLNAGQVVARLSALSQDELATVLEYERAHRNRRAVIEKGDNLTAAPPWPTYDQETAEDIVARLDADHAAAVREYESRHRRRVTVLEAAQRELSGSA